MLDVNDSVVNYTIEKRETLHIISSINDNIIKSVNSHQDMMPDTIYI
jgi:hypothetical protein